jgi:hypothetical protein
MVRSFHGAKKPRRKAPGWILPVVLLATGTKAAHLQILTTRARPDEAEQSRVPHGPVPPAPLRAQTGEMDPVKRYKVRC